MVTQIRIMSLNGQSQGRANGQSGFFQNIARYGLIAASAIAGLFVLLLTASAAIVIVLSLLLIGALVFAYFWVRAKVFGKPLGGEAFAQMRAAAQAQKDAQNSAVASGLFTRSSEFDDSDIIDAHKTPDGWSVDS